MANVSPGVYTKITDLSTYIQAVPSTIGFVCGFSEKGRDNELVFVGSRADFVSEWGTPNISLYGKHYGQGPYIAYNHLGESGALYWMRLLPDDATYANIRINGVMANDATAADITITRISGLNSISEIQTHLASSGDVHPLAFLIPIGRGQWYNSISVRLTPHSNPILNGVYVLDIYERQSDGQEVIIESFDVSFDPQATDIAGESLFIVNVLETYSSVLRCVMTLANGDYAPGYELLVKVFDKDIGRVSVDLTPASAMIEDNKQDFSDWQTNPETGMATYVVIAKDAKGNEIWGWLGAADGVDDEQIHVFTNRNLSSPRGWNGDVATFDVNSTITYVIKKSHTNLAAPFLSAHPRPLRKGSDGSLVQTDGTIDQTEAEALLEKGYSGIGLTNPRTGMPEDSILDTENVYFSVVYDAGYPSDVKKAISTLCQTRGDCVGLLDNGDNNSVTNALSARQSINTFNNYYVALYESYNKVPDPFTNEDVWFSPIYHMAYLLPRNDSVAEPWFAVAGYQRASIESIKELRFNPRLGERDQMYLRQLNPIVKFSDGYVVWGQLTSQTRASALQNLSAVRLVLYCKRAIEQFCRYFVFEKNDSVTWAQVASEVVNFLEVVKNKRGLYNYTVEVGATDYEKKTKKFHVNVTLEPTRDAEQIELNFFIS